MSEYKLFGEHITLSDSAERFFDLQQEAWDACDRAETDIKAWYQERDNIEDALDNYVDEAQSLVARYALTPLYNRLTSEYEIFDISEKSYLETCFKRSKIEEAYDLIAEKFNAIIAEQEAAREYRQERKDSRGRWEGGGFGVEGAIKGAATAGALNAVSGMGHGLVNAIGNLGSSIAAASSKRDLYNSASTLSVLCEGVREEIMSVFNAHINLINKLKDEKYISFSSDSDKAGALLENAKKVPEKAPELLVRSFTLYPWSYKLLKYIFVNYPQERANAWSISKRFHVDLTDDIEEAIAREYTDEDRHSEERAQEAKKRIVPIMQEYNVSESATLDMLEQDCIGRLCAGYEKTDKAGCLSMIANITEYAAQEKIKKPFLDQVNQRLIAVDMELLEQLCQGYETADKPRCLSLIENVKAYDALESNKKIILDKLNQRLTAVDMELLKQLCQGYETADKARCLSLIESVKAYDALELNKKTMLDKLNQRLTVADMEQLEQLCQGYETADKPHCLSLMESVKAFNAFDSNKKAMLGKLQSRIDAIETAQLNEICQGYETADEPRCKSIIEDIQAFDGSKELKKAFLSKIEQRLKEIWAAEDGIIFDNIFIQTNIEDSDAIKRSIEYIKQQNDRTGIAKKYIDTLNKCNPNTIKNARMYRNPMMRSVYTGLWGALLISAIFTQFVFQLGIIFTAIEVIAGIAVLFLTSHWKNDWNKLTINNTIFHPALTQGTVPTNQEPSKLIFVAIFTVILVVITFVLSQSI